MLAVNDLFNESNQSHQLVKDVSYYIFWAIKPWGVITNSSGGYYDFRALKNHLTTIKNNIERNASKYSSTPEPLRRKILEEINKALNSANALESSRSSRPITPSRGLFSSVTPRSPAREDLTEEADTTLGYREDR